MQSLKSLCATIGLFALCAILTWIVPYWLWVGTLPSWIGAAIFLAIPCSLLIGSAVLLYRFFRNYHALP